MVYDNETTVQWSYNDLNCMHMYLIKDEELAIETVKELVIWGGSDFSR